MNMNLSLKFVRCVVLAAAFGPLLAGTPVGAARTYVSGVGNDGNTCTRTAPCRTFAAAYALTPPGGEISALDSGDFGTLNIAKAITVSGASTKAGIVAYGGDGIVISAGPADVVVLRNLSIRGFSSYIDSSTLYSSAAHGVRFLSGRELVIDDCDVFNFTSRNISIESSTSFSVVLISNTTVHDSLGNGIAVTPPVNNINQVVIDNVKSVGNGSFGVAASPGAALQIRNSILSNNTGGGLWVSNTTIEVESTLISGNGVGVQCVGNPSVFLAAVTVMMNTTGLSFPVYSISSFGDNRIFANTYGNGPISNFPPKQ